MPVRALAVWFSASTNVTEPIPCPVAPLVTVIQGAVLTADQVHCVPVMTVTVRLPGVEGEPIVVGDTLYVHWASAAEASRIQTRATNAQQREIVIFLALGRPAPSSGPGRCTVGAAWPRPARDCFSAGYETGDPPARRDSCAI